MTIKDMVADRLRADGYDGLCRDKCGCRLNDLLPCGKLDLRCRPGRIRYGTFDGKQTWIIVEPNSVRGGRRATLERTQREGIK